MIMKLLIIPLAAISFAITSHAQSGGGSMPGTTAETTTTAISQGEAAEILKTANEAEIDLAQAAKHRAENKEVKEFAKSMEDMHKESNKEAKKIFKKADIDTKNNEMAKSMKKDAKEKLADLKKKKGNDFDKAYIENQIAMHEQVLKDLNEKLIPAAQNPEFKAFLETTKAHVEEHLSKAQQIQQSITK